MKKKPKKEAWQIKRREYPRCCEVHQLWRTAAGIYIHI